MMNQVDFIFNQVDKIQIILDLPLGQAASCDSATLYFVSKYDDKILLAKSFISEILESLISLLKKTLVNDMALPTSILDDIGYIWNKELHGEGGLEYIAHGDQCFWVGSKYYLWETPSNSEKILATWLYNDMYGNIVFEITPVYPGHFDDPTDIEEFVFYEEWMKAYKPLLIREISYDTAKRWLAQAEHLLAIIEQNENIA